MGYTVVEATRSDAPELATVFLEAFKDDPILGQIWPDVAPDVLHPYHARRFAEYFDNLERDGSVYRKVIDDEGGKLVAFAKWQYPHIMTAEQKAEKEKAEENEEPSPAGTNLEIRKVFFGALDALRKKHMDDSKDYLLHLLCVSPTHQRQGLGTLLINQGLAVADEHNAKTYIEASPKGLGLYLKHGWKPVDEIVIDMKEYGGSMVAREKCLMRQPGGQ